LQNLNAKDLAMIERLAQHPQLAPWDATLTQFVLSSDSKLAGQTLEEAKFRTLTGATVAMIDRGSRRIFAPSRSDRLLPNDELFLIGTEEQLAAAQKVLEPEPTVGPLKHDELYNLESLLLDERTPYVNKSIREIGLGEEFGGLIVGIERGSQRILNPESSVVLRPGDLIWIFGRRDRIKELKRTLGGRAEMAQPRV
jgi:CPA2 family monovalent cation:H+ antiporter-2